MWPFRHEMNQRNTVKTHTELFATISAGPTVSKVKISFTETLKKLRVWWHFFFSSFYFDPVTSKLINFLKCKIHQKSFLTPSLIAELSYITEMLSYRATKEPWTAIAHEKQCSRITHIV